MGEGRPDLKRLYAHSGFPCGHRHIVISNSEFRKFVFGMYSELALMSRMFTPIRSSLFVTGLALVLAFAAATIPWTPDHPQAAASLDFSIEQFGRYIEQWSEEEGYFDSDNFISN